MPAADFADVFAALKPVLSKHDDKLQVKADSPTDYMLHTRRPSPFPQHKGEPLFFASIRLGKAYVSFHLMPLYMCPELKSQIGPALKKRMQGKACFNFKGVPDAEQLAGLRKLTASSLTLWKEKDWA
jgi:hypothetical protein